LQSSNFGENERLVKDQSVATSCNWILAEKLAKYSTDHGTAMGRVFSIFILADYCDA
jgi:hypothetical protein